MRCSRRRLCCDFPKATTAAATTAAATTTFEIFCIRETKALYYI